MKVATLLLKLSMKFQCKLQRSKILKPLSSKTLEIETLMKSVSAFASEIGYSHTAVGNTIKKLESERGITIGILDGRTRLLSPAEQEIIRAIMPPKAPKEGSIVLRTNNTITRLEAPSLPLIPELVVDDIDTSAIDNHNDVLDAYSSQLDEALKEALLNAARRDAKALKPQIKAVYKSVIVEAKSEVLRENLGAK